MIRTVNTNSSTLREMYTAVKREEVITKTPKLLRNNRVLTDGRRDKKKNLSDINCEHAEENLERDI